MRNAKAENITVCHATHNQYDGVDIGSPPASQGFTAVRISVRYLGLLCEALSRESSEFLVFTSFPPWHQKVNAILQEDVIDCM